MTDLNMENVLKKAILGLCEKGYTPKVENLWHSLTRMMFKNYSATLVYGMVNTALAEASDEQWFEHKYPKDFWNENWKCTLPTKKLKNIPVGDTKKFIDSCLKITDVAKHYGLKVRANKCVCPFHADSDPSLSLSDKKNVFNCFGCHIKGDIIEFIRLMEGLKNEKK